MSGSNGKVAPSAGALQSLCPASLIPASHPGASQGLTIDGEPDAASPTYSSGARHSMTRRFLMNSIEVLPIAAAVPVAGPSIAAAGDDPKAGITRLGRALEFLQATSS